MVSEDCCTWHININYFFLTRKKGCAAALGMENEGITDVQINSSSQLDDTHSASEARLNYKADGSERGSWSALTNDFNQWLQVDLGTFNRVTRVATQGRNGRDQWVTRYRLQYSDDGVTFLFYKEFVNSSAKVCELSTVDRS